MGDFRFTFKNDSSTDVAITTVMGSIFEGFLGDFGLPLSISWVQSGMSAVFSPTKLASLTTFDFDTVIGANSSDTLRVSYGGFTGPADAKGPVQGTIDLSVSGAPSPVPLPAAGWLLFAGLGGIAALKRKKSAA